MTRRIGVPPSAPLVWGLIWDFGFMNTGPAAEFLASAEAYESSSWTSRLGGRSQLMDFAMLKMQKLTPSKI